MSSKTLAKRYKLHHPKSILPHKKISSPHILPTPAPSCSFLHQTHWVLLTNEYLFRQVSKKSVQYVHNLYIGFDILDSPNISRTIRYLKKLKYTNLLVCDALFNNPIKTSKILRLFYTKTRGISSPFTSWPVIPNRCLDLHTLKKFKFLSHLHLKTAGCGNSSRNALQVRSKGNTVLEEISGLKSSLMALRNLKTMLVIDNYKDSHELLFEMLARQISLKPSLQKIGLFIVRKYTCSHKSLSTFLKSLGTLRNLEEVLLYLEGLDVTPENIEILCDSLIDKKNLKFARLELNQPSISPDFTKFSTIPILKLDMTMKLISYDLTVLSNVFSSLTNPVIIRIDEVVENEKLIDRTYMDSFFQIIARIPQLVQFSYGEARGAKLSYTARVNVMENIPHILERNLKSLVKLHVSLDNSLGLEVLLKTLKKSSSQFKALKSVIFDIFDYSEGTCSEKAISDFLDSMRHVETLKEMFFSINGEIDDDFSRIIIRKLAKMRKLRSLGSFLVKVTPERLLSIFRKLEGLNELEKLLLWFVPIEEGMQEGFEEIKEELFEKIAMSVRKMTNLVYINLRFAIPGYGEEDFKELRGKLKIENTRLNVKIC